MAHATEATCPGRPGSTVSPTSGVQVKAVVVVEFKVHMYPVTTPLAFTSVAAEREPNGPIETGPEVGVGQ